LLEEVSRLAEGRDVMVARRAKAEVLNYLKMLEHIDSYQKDGMISAKNIAQMVARYLTKIEGKGNSTRYVMA